MVRITLGGLGAATLFGMQILFFKEQMKRCEDAFFSAFTYLLFCGSFGLLSVIYYLIFDIQVFADHTLI